MTRLVTYCVSQTPLTAGPQVDELTLKTAIDPIHVPELELGLRRASAEVVFASAGCPFIFIRIYPAGAGR
jgi:hypothetical protein